MRAWYLPHLYQAKKPGEEGISVSAAASAAEKRRRKRKRKKRKRHLGENGDGESGVA